MDMATSGQKEIDCHQNCFIGDSRVSSMKTTEASYGCGHEWIVMVKTSHSLNQIKNWKIKMQSWPCRMSLLMEATVLKGVKLISIMR
jgi:hypothetical protein